MTQPLFCSADAPWGIHLSIRDNVCTRCGWIPPRFAGAASLTLRELDAGGDGEEDGAG